MNQEKNKIIALILRHTNAYTETELTNYSAAELYKLFKQLMFFEKLMEKQQQN